MTTLSAHPAIHQAMTAREWAMMVVLSMLWGGSFFFTAIGVEALPPLTLVALRLGLAAPALWLALWVTRIPLPWDARNWGRFLFMGVFNAGIPFALIVWAQTHLPSGVASILNASAPLFTVIVAHFQTRDEKMTPARLLGVAIGFAGVAVMIGPDALRDLGVDVAAECAILLAGISYAFGSVFARRFARYGVAPLAVAAGQMTAGAPVITLAAILIEQPWLLQSPGPTVWAAVFGYAMLSTALAFILYFRVLATAGAINIVLVTFLIPVSAVLLGVAFLGERLEIQHIAGFALVGLGLAVLDGRPFRALRRRSGS